jgi:diguanylate cyclase (GGDEF)-like protein/PAS domain S-box-containing protein
MSSHSDQPSAQIPTLSPSTFTAGQASPAYRDLLESLADGVYFVDRDRRISYWNQSAERITGFSREEVVGSRCHDNVLNHVDVSGRALCLDHCPLLETMRTGKRCAADVYLHHKDGTRVPVLVRATPVIDSLGTITGAVEVFSDNSAKLAYIDRISELERLAMIDPLTLLPNRRYFDDRFQNHLGELDRYGWQFGLMLVDIDFFKRVNDSMGHDMGDAVLRLVARTLHGNCRATDTVARWGGEEFAIIVSNANEHGLRCLAEKLRVLVGTSGLRTPKPVHVTISIGGTVALQGETAEAILKRADQCLFEAKRSGRDRVSIRP